LNLYPIFFQIIYSPQIVFCSAKVRSGDAITKQGILLGINQTCDEMFSYELYIMHFTAFEYRKQDMQKIRSGYQGIMKRVRQDRQQKFQG
jgi:hypothetical protein